VGGLRPYGGILRRLELRVAVWVVTPTGAWLANHPPYLRPLQLGVGISGAVEAIVHEVSWVVMEHG
jgi:hypothetical protein